MEILIALLILIILALLSAWSGQKRKSQQIEDELKKTKTELTNNLRKKWLTRVSNSGHSYKNEIEVEVKFVYTLLRLLGYRDSDLDIRVSVEIPAGHQLIPAQADWLVWKKNNKGERQPFMVIEAKAQSIALDEKVASQARSYAFVLNTPIYVLTNGVELQVYIRNIVNDQLAFSCEVKQLHERWDELQTLIGAHQETIGEQVTVV